MTDDSYDPQAEQERQKDLQEHSSAVNTGMQVAASEVERNIRNPDFLSAVQEHGLDDLEEFGWLEEEIGPDLSGSHLLASREEGYAAKSELLDRNQAERIIVEKSPGRILRQNPLIWRVMNLQQEDLVENDHIQEPMADSADRRATRGAMDVVTARKALAEDMAGLDAMTKVRTETERVSESREEESGVKSAIKSAYR